MLASRLPRTAAWLHHTAHAAAGVRGYLASVGLQVDAPPVRALSMRVHTPGGEAWRARLRAVRKMWGCTLLVRGGHQEAVV